MKCTRIGEKRCNCSCFEIDHELDAILLIIGIVYGVWRIVIKLIQQCTYFLFSVNLLLVGVNYGQRTMHGVRKSKHRNLCINIIWICINFVLHDMFYCAVFNLSYVFSCVICFRFIHFILISTAHALFLTCLPVSMYGT
jgi:hypothetical protein